MKHEQAQARQSTPTRNASARTTTLKGQALPALWPRLELDRQHQLAQHVATLILRLRQPSRPSQTEEEDSDAHG